MRLVLLVAIIAPLLTPEAFAANEGSTYAGIQLGFGEYHDDAVENVIGGNEAYMNSVIFRYGKHFSENFAFEGRLGTGITEDELGEPPFEKINVETDYIFGVYGLINFYTGSNSSYYGILGYSEIGMTGSQSNFSLSGSDNGLSYGFGANFGPVNLEYLNYLEQDDYNYFTLSLGYNFEL